ncbi:hypothetical protein JOC78_001626 [Bacillus ectoiniformans]|uniref:FixH family protein n=1 Tax=Bacillus ectoiniformans TaxID=1494429 RepID=UPI00195AF983|nr:FixH family protein [Bacillus ectoiniformans]MBM7648680.1 hypothetical protein [Bacillus ectoiniformans]
MKKIWMIAISILLLLVAGCSGEESQKEKAPEKKEKIVSPLDVKIQMPEEIVPNQEVKVEAHVTQGDKKVEDASEVKFEVFKSGVKETEMIKGEHQGEGIYSMNKVFEEEGSYSVVAHVTARDLHSMPKKDFQVGSGEAHHHDATTAEHSHDHGHHHGSTAEIDFQAIENIQLNEETLLAAKITNEGQPLLNANVRFEIWPEGIEKHEFIDAEEKDGEYEAKYTFSEKGKFTVKVHVEKEELHEHIEEIVEVN